MDAFNQMGLIGNNYDPNLLGRINDSYETRSGSDHFEGGSGDDQEANDHQPPRKKKYHRHTPTQIQELESLFKECPHPDEKQRMDLSRRLGLASKQIKFWFQNRRTQMKTQLERHENLMLRQENDKLRSENVMLKQAINLPMCNNCGGQTIPGDVSIEQHHLSIENARLKDDLTRMCVLADKFIGGQFSSGGPPTGLELGVGRNGPPLPMRLDFADGIGIPGPMLKPMMDTMPVSETQIDKSAVINLALAAMDELIKVAHADSPLWMKSYNGKNEMFNVDEYTRTFSPCIGMKPTNFVTEASRADGVVVINGLTLVDMLMDASRWQELFPSMVVRASTIEVISNAVGANKNGMLQMMHAEFQLLSPLVPARQTRFIRFCKQHADDLWAVVDVSIDVNLDGAEMPSYVTRRQPSGCIIQDMPNGCCKVTWVEHSENDESLVHELYQPLIRSGMGFGAYRIVATLQRQCEFLSLFSNPTISDKDHTAVTPGGKKCLLKLAQRMADSFCTGVCASSVRKWHKLNGTEDVMVSTRQNINNPGEPPGLVLNAATSVYIHVSRLKLFDFLRDEKMRNEWDILSNSGIMEEMAHISKAERPGNCVSLLRAHSMNLSDQNNGKPMLVLQESWHDASGSLVVYAPVDLPSISQVMNGGDSSYVALLPSGFSILPAGRSIPGGSSNSNGTLLKQENNESDGCLLTIGFQILVNSLPTAKITQESVDTVNTLMSCTKQKIKVALQGYGKEVKEMLGRNFEMVVAREGGESRTNLGWRFLFQTLVLKLSSESSTSLNQSGGSGIDLSNLRMGWVGPVCCYADHIIHLVQSHPCLTSGLAKSVR
ncbi:hypothetical protein ACFE04_004098 [Oxalis oulophora]